MPSRRRHGGDGGMKTLLGHMMMSIDLRYFIHKYNVFSTIVTTWSVHDSGFVMHPGVPNYMLRVNRVTGNREGTIATAVREEYRRYLDYDVV